MIGIRAHHIRFAEANAAANESCECVSVLAGARIRDSISRDALSARATAAGCKRRISLAGGSDQRALAETERSAFAVEVVLPEDAVFLLRDREAHERRAQNASEKRLLEVLDPLDVETVGAVDIAEEHDGEIALHRVFHLN